MDCPSITGDIGRRAVQALVMFADAGVLALDRKHARHSTSASRKFAFAPSTWTANAREERRPIFDRFRPARRHHRQCRRAGGRRRPADRVCLIDPRRTQSRMRYAS